MSPTQSTIPKVSLWSLIPTLLKGKSYVRAWMENRLALVAADGLILDFGGGGSKNSERIQRSPRSRVITLDTRIDVAPTVVGDGEKNLPLKKNCFDLVLLLNTLEHIFEYRSPLTETARVLKPGGRLVLFVPYLYPRHTARYDTYFVADYFRFGPEALQQLIKDAGFTGPINIDVCGEGPFTAAANILALEMPFGFLRVFIHGAGGLIDALFMMLKKGKNAQASREWPLAYWVVAEK